MSHLFVYNVCNHSLLLYVTPLTLDDHPTTTTVTGIDTDMGEGSGTSNLRRSTTVTGIDTGPGEDSGNTVYYVKLKLLY